jgi:hypothetical protein
MKASQSLAQLFVSQARRKLIQQLFYSPSDIFYVRQLVRLVDEEINSVRRELANLLSVGLVLTETRGNRVYYWANPLHPLFYDLLVLTHKTSGLGEAVAKSSDKVGSLKLLLYSQHYLHHQTSPLHTIDMIFIGKLILREIENLVKHEEEVLGREINYMVMDKSEFHLRQLKRDPVLVDFFLSYPAVIIGDPTSITTT